MLDTAIERATITELTDDELDAMLVQIRERRLVMLRKYEEAQLVLDAQLETDKREELVDALSKVSKDYELVNARIDKFEKLVTKIRALRLELES